MYCTKCGTRNDDTALTCVQCGSSLRPHASIHPTDLAIAAAILRAASIPQAYMPTPPTSRCRPQLSCAVDPGHVLLLPALRHRVHYLCDPGEYEARLGRHAGALHASKQAKPLAWISFGFGGFVGTCVYPALASDRELANSTEATLQALISTNAEARQHSSGILLAAMLGRGGAPKPGHAPLLPACPLHRFTGFLCPGCGSTRALYLLLHGHPLGALRENGLAVLLLPVLIYDLAAMISARRLPPERASSLETNLDPTPSHGALRCRSAISRWPPFIYLRPMSIP